MKRYPAPLVVSLALAAAHSFAREPQAPPSPSVDSASRSGMIGKGAAGSSMFVGHYGEILEIPYGWTAEAEMRGETEAVYLHRKSHDAFGFKPFHPNISDYKPENFAPMGFMELIVIPKNAPGGLPSLKAIRGAKEVELKQSGAEYEIFDETGDGDWPRTTFHVNTKKPYRLWQTYAESPNEFYILTVGGEVETGDYGLDEARVLNYRSASQLVSRSLGNHVLAAHKRSLGGTLFRYRAGAADGLFSDFIDLIGKPPLMRIVLGALGAMMLILALWPGTSTSARRVGLFGRSLLLFTLFTGLAGFLVVFIPARFGDALWNSNELALLIPVLIIPGISWAAARALGSARPKRVLASTGIVAAAWATAFLWGADFKNVDEAAILAVGNTIILLLVGLTFGIAFGLGFGPLPKKEIPR